MKKYLFGLGAMSVGGDRQGGGEENKTSSKLRVSMRGNLYLFVPIF